MDEPKKCKLSKTIVVVEVDMGSSEPNRFRRDVRRFDASIDELPDEQRVLKIDECVDLIRANLRRAAGLPSAASSSASPEADEQRPSKESVLAAPAPGKVERRRLPDTRQSVTKKIHIVHSGEDGKPATLDVYVTVGLYDDGTPGEIFMRAGKMGSTVSGLLDAVSICISIGLQSGVPMEWFVGKLKGMRFDPEGPTNDPKIRRAGSMVDAVMRWLDDRFVAPVPPAPGEGSAAT